MASIFYDLETSALERVGQLLNFAFVVVDDDFEVLDTLTAKVRISRLQLPRAGAVCANRTDVLAHQNESSLSEYEAVQVITDFFRKHAPKYREASVSLIGFNNQQFDLPFLRTVFVRNGFHPYPRGFVHRDLYLTARKLLVTNDIFRRKICRTPPGVKDWLPTLRLENITQQLGLLEHSQTHESLDDVLLTIRLAKYFRTEFEEDILAFEPYQVRHLHGLTNGTPVQLREPMRKGFSFEHFEKNFPAVLLDANERYSLWIRLDQYKLEKETNLFNRSSIAWRKFQEHVVLSGELLFEHEEELRTVGLEALDTYKGVTLSSYFDDRECDIEQFIYRIPMAEFTELFEAIQLRKPSAELSADSRQLVKRSWLERWLPGDSAEDEFKKSLREYARYRYGGRLLMEKYQKDGSDVVKYHPTLKDLHVEIEHERTVRGESAELILTNLEKFYRESEITQVAGEELLR